MLVVYNFNHNKQYISAVNECEKRFFVEEPIYWDPENSTKTIYEQIAQRRYREIPRQAIRFMQVQSAC